MSPIYRNPALRAFYDLTKQKFAIEAFKQPKIKKLDLKTLRPLRDIDDNIISYSSTTGKLNKVDSTSYDDCFEKMSFERCEDELYDTFREDELFDQKRDYTGFFYSKYSEDDIPVNQHTILAEVGGKTKIDNIYYPDTDLSRESITTLKRIHFSEQITSEIESANLKLDDNAIKDYIRIAIDAWEKSIPEQNIIKLVKKSIRKGGFIHGTDNLNGRSSKIRIASTPDSKLFEFLTKFPNDRNLVVIASKQGYELLDDAAVLYYPAFVEKYFGSTNTAKEVLKNCKTISSHYFDDIDVLVSVPKVDKNLCEIVSLMRRKSAHGIKINNEEMLDRTYGSKIYCGEDIPWTEDEAKLLKSLKTSLGFLDEGKYNAAKILLRDYGYSVKKTLENLEYISARSKKIDSVKTQLQMRINNSDKDSAKIMDLLKKEFEEDIYNSKSLSSLGANSLLINSAEKLLEHEIKSSTMFTILEKIKSLRKFFVENNELCEKFIKLSTTTDNNGQIILLTPKLKFLTSLLSNKRSIEDGEKVLRLFDNSKLPFSEQTSRFASNAIEQGLSGDELVQIFNKYLKDKPLDEQKMYLKAFDIISGRLSYYNIKEIEKNLDRNIDETVKFMNTLEEKVNQLLPSFRANVRRIGMRELEYSCTDKDFSAENSKILKKLDKCLNGLLSYKALIFGY